MGIRVECPNGHVFKVKDKYAGKKGVCPHCKGHVVVHVPATVDSFSHDVLDGVNTMEGASSSSLLGGSAVKHSTRACKSCGMHNPYWHAKCAGCGTFQDN